MSPPVRVGTVGAGSLGYHHIRILRDLPGVEFAGFAEVKTERAEAVAAELGVTNHQSLESLLDVTDAITVVVPTPNHHAVARVALERGKHVLIEKPLASTLEEADDLIAIASRTGAIIQTGHVERFNRAIRAALPFIDIPRFIESDRLAPFNPRGSDVAVVLDLMIHDIDLVRTLVGGHVVELSAVGVPVLTPSVDIANARLTFGTGAVANITASRVSRDRMRKIRIFQRSGYLSLDLAQGNGEFYRMRGDVDTAILMKSPQELLAFVERIPLEAPEGEPLRLEFESFVAAVQGIGPVVVSGEDGREALAVALRIVSEIERTLPALAGHFVPGSGE
ncbi:MAG: Gfo/Idh/MocA family oxidoreductase [Gemmatimonadaceae bacterium]|nr:Gfo/Idh/MocA family oxidoreductase [Gemmatimonadaceae bacterium]MDQ3519658.1 Gfo/Idh/MocA family oxidoreductase [Gemmatimonadota bacterium]